LLDVNFSARNCGVVHERAIVIAMSAE
jgi:hypothetical protein